MNPIIVVFILSSFVSPLHPLQIGFNIKNASPGCGNAVVMAVTITSPNGSLIVSTSKAFYFTDEEILSGNLSGVMSVPLNVTVPGTYTASVITQYCGVKKTRIIPFSIAGVTLSTYKMDVSKDSIEFTLTFKNTDNQSWVVFSRADVIIGNKTITSIVKPQEVPPKSTVDVPLKISTKKLPGGVATIKVSYTYLGNTYSVTEQVVPIQNGSDNGKSPIDQRVIIAIVVAFFVLGILLRK